MALQLLAPVSLATALGLMVLCGAAASDGDGGARPAALRLYVSSAGSDSSTGRRPQPAATDGPFATLRRARDEVRRARAAGMLPDGGAVIFLRGGRYELSEPLELGPEDSGRPGAPVVYRPYRGEQVRLVGGRLVTGWRPVRDPAVLARVDEAARPHLWEADLPAQGIREYGIAGELGARMELFCGDARMPLARWPNDGYAQLAGVLPNDPIGSYGHSGDRVGNVLYEGDRPRRWAGEPDIWFYGFWFWDWASGFQKAARIDPERRLIALAEPYHNYGFRAGQRYYALNLLCELDRPGEWYLDRTSGMLYLWPLSSAEPVATTVSTIASLLTLRGASHITFRGLTLEATQDTAVTLEQGERVRLVDCVIRNTGSSAARISGGRGHAIERCHIHDTAQGAILLDGGDRRTLTASGHVVRDCHIHHLGRVALTYCPAVWMHGVGHLIAHNLIHDIPHGAIMATGNEHRVEYNRIHDVCMETRDAGVFYMGLDWTERGTVVRYNFIHDIAGEQKHNVNSIYLDDMASGQIIYGNVFCRAGRAVLIGGGRDNRVENNIMVDCDPGLWADARAVGWAQGAAAEGSSLHTKLLAVPYADPPWSVRYPELLTVWQDEPGLPKGNIVRRNISWKGRWTELHGAAQALFRVEENLVGVDPLFVDAEAMDFRLREDSPAWALGFEPIPFERIGPRREAASGD